MKNRINYIAGLTLIEIMIGVIITSIMMAAVYTSYSVVNQSYSQVTDKAKISRASRDIVTMLMRDVRMAGFKYYAGSHEIAQYASNTSECNNGSGIVLPKNSYLHFDNGFDGNPQDSHNALVIRKNTLGFGIISDTSTSLSTNNTNATGSTASTGSNCCDQIQIVYEDFNQNDYSDGKQPYKKYRITYYAQPNDTGGFAAYKRVEHYSQPRNGCDLIAQATPPPQNDGGNDPLGDGNLFNLENQFGVNRDPNAGGIVGSGVSDDSADVSSINKGLWLTDCNECTPQE